MRTTQYIGLTKKAQNFAAQLSRVEDSENQTCGMFNEKVALGEWWCEGRGEYLREVVQAEPWSSGPMIFTCLVWTKDKAVAKQTKGQWEEDFWFVPEPDSFQIVELSRWKEDPDLCRYGQEYDSETGRFGV